MLHLANSIYSISWISPEEASQVVDLVKLCYGDSYPDVNFYNAERLKKLFQEKKLLSAVVKEENKIVGHLCLCPSQWEMVWLFFCGLVHPHFRGNHFLSSLMSFMVSYMGDIGRRGCYSEMVMYNLASQKSSILAGGGECAFFYGRIPPSYKKRWNNTLLFFFPSHHKLPPIYNFSSFYVQEIFSIAHRFGMEVCRREGPSLGKKNKVEVRFIPVWSTSEMLVEDLTEEKDCISFWEEKLTLLRKEPVRGIYLNLSHPRIDRWITLLRDRGYFFAGMIPHFFSSGSALILQHIDIQKVSLSFNDKFVTDFGKQIFDFCERDRSYNIT